MQNNNACNSENNDDSIFVHARDSSSHQGDHLYQVTHNSFSAKLLSKLPCKVMARKKSYVKYWQGSH